MTPHVLVFGTSEPQDFQITNDNAPLVGTGFTIGIEFRATTSLGQALTAGQIAALSLITVAWLSQVAGTVRLTGTATIPIGSYPFRWTLTDVGSKKGFVPNLDDSPNLLRVVAV